MQIPLSSTTVARYVLCFTSPWGTGQKGPAALSPAPGPSSSCNKSMWYAPAASISSSRPGTPRRLSGRLLESRGKHTLL